MKGKFFKRIISWVFVIALAMVLTVSAVVPAVITSLSKARFALQPISFLDAKGNWSNSADSRISVTNPGTEDFTDFTKTAKHTVTDDNVKNLNNVIVWDRENSEVYPDISGATYGMFWIKAAKNVGLTVRIWTENYVQSTKELDITAAEGWQKIVFKLPETDGNWEAVSSKLKQVSVVFTSQEDIATGDTFEYGRMYFFDAKPVEYTTLKAEDTTPAVLIGSLDAKGGYNDSTGTKVQTANAATEDFTDFTATLKHTVLSDIAVDKNVSTWIPEGTAYPTMTGATYGMFWVKTAKNISIRLRLWTENYANASTEVNITAADGWQKVIFKLPTENGHWANIVNKLLKVSVEFKSVENISEGDIFEYGRMYFFDKEPKNISTLKPDYNTPAVLIGSLDAKGNWSNSADSRISVSNPGTNNFTDFTKTAKHTVTADVVPSLNNVIVWDRDNSEVYPDISDAAYGMFWIKSVKNVSLTVRIWTDAYVQASKEINITAAEGWQKIVFKLPTENGHWDAVSSKLKHVSVVFTSQSEISTGDTFEYGRMYFFDKEPKNFSTYRDNEDEAPKCVNTAVPYNPYGDSSVSGKSTISAELFDVNDNSNFQKGVNVKLLSKNYYTAADKKVLLVAYGKDTTADISDAIEDGILRFWVKTKNQMSFHISIFGSDGTNHYSGYSKSPVIDVLGKSKWQEVRVNLTDFTGNIDSFKTNKLSYIMLEPVETDTAENNKFLSEGGSVDFGPFEFWNKSIEIDIDPDGGTVIPNNTYPPKLEDLPKADENEKSRKVDYTDINRFWIDEWNVNSGDERLFKMSINAFEKTDEMYSKFTHWRDFSIADESFYSLPINNHEAMLTFQSHPIDISDYVRDGYLRLYVKVPKKMTIRFGLKNDGTISWATPSVNRTIEPTNENSGFVEIQIPIKEIYQAAVDGNMRWDPATIGSFIVAPASGVQASAESYLKVGEVLSVSTVELWTKKPLEPEPYDPTRFFYCGNGSGILLKDINEIMPNTTVINAMHNTYEKDRFTKIFNKSYSGGAKVYEILTVRTMTDTEYDRHYTEPYDTVELMLPIEKFMNTAGLKVAVVSEAGEFTPLDYTIDSQYMIIPTIAMGDFVFYTASGKLNWEWDKVVSGAKDPENAGSVDGTGDSTISDSDGTSSDKPSSGKNDKSKSSGGIIWWILGAVILVAAITTLIVILIRKGKNQYEK